MSYVLKLFPTRPADVVNRTNPSSEQDPVRVGDVLYRLEVVSSTDGGDARTPLPTAERIQQPGAVGQPEANRPDSSVLRATGEPWSADDSPRGVDHVAVDTNVRR